MSSPPKEKMSGWLVINKPLEMSSAHVVARVKRLVGKHNKVGHAGTLDPLASGILPIAIGEATKLAQYLIDSSKEYEFEVTWGEERSTDDAEGEVVASSEKRVTREDIESILPKFRGNIEQVPPQYSAIKVEGKRAYDTARKGGETELKARKVHIKQLLATNYSLQATTFTLSCSKGTYVRSLARDMGRQLGCYGYVSKLHRTRHGKFGENSAITLEHLEEICKKGATAEAMLPVQEVLDGIPAFPLSEFEEKQIRYGIPLNKDITDSDMVALYSGNKLVAIASSANGKVVTKRVFN